MIARPMAAVLVLCTARAHRESQGRKPRPAVPHRGPHGDHDDHDYAMGRDFMSSTGASLAKQVAELPGADVILEQE
jgi:hypothetical protein